MKKIIYVMIAIMILGLFISGCENVVPEVLESKGPSAPAGNSNNGKLYLYEKDPTDWSIVEDGAWGKMTYSLSGEEFDFVFNGKGLEADTDYTLIVYKGEDWPGQGICLGSGTTTNGGNVNIAESVPMCASLDEVKIWLVLSADVTDCFMSAWNPCEYLFENELISFEYTGE
jgi:hypothetical protein